MKIKCVAIDDEPLALQLIEANIARIGYLQLMNTFSSPLRAREFIEKEKPDLLFLDIQMPGLTGLEFARLIRNGPMIIFTTAFDKYAIDGFDLNAIDYVLKPIRFDRFKSACDKAKEFLEWKQKAASVKTEFILIRSEHRLVKLFFTDITHIEGLKDYVKIFCSGESKPVLTRMNLKGMEDLLPPDIFCRAHKSYIINTKKILSTSKDSISLGELTVPMGESYRENVLRLFTS